MQRFQSRWGLQEVALEGRSEYHCEDELIPARSLFGRGNFDVFVDNSTVNIRYSFNGTDQHWPLNKTCLHVKEDKSMKLKPILYVCYKPESPKVAKGMATIFVLIIILC